MSKGSALVMGVLLCSSPLAAFAQVVNPARDVAVGAPAIAGDTVVPGGVTAVVVASGGASYATGNTIALAGGACSSTPALVVTAVSSGAITGVIVASAGFCSTLPGNPVAQSATSGSGVGATFTLSWTAQPVTLFGGTVPANGWKVANPDPVSDLWANDNGIAAPGNGVRVVANGGQYATEPGERPSAAVSVYGTTIGQKINARRW